MAQDDNKPAGPDLTKGIPSTDLADGKMLTGLVGDEEVLLVRQGGAVHAIGAHCTHYQGPLKDGLVVGDTIRCPWHHACFSLKTGEALAAPALSPLPCWRTEERDGTITVKGKIEPKSPAPAGKASEHFIIVGGGAAGFTAAQMLRHRGFAGRITMISNDTAAPVDRPNLSKDYLAGSAPEDWVPLRGNDWYAEKKIDLRLNTEVVSIEPQAKRVTLADGKALTYDKLLLATGAEPVKLDIPGAGQKHVHTLRSFADSRAIIHLAKTARSAVVIGASFIGLEAAASLRRRELEVHVVAPEKRPLERVFGPQFGDFVLALHEEHGVHFHLENSVTAIGAHDVTLKSGDTVAADLVVMGVGVRPRLTLAEKAGLRMDKGLCVNEYLETSAPDIYAAGDIARWPDPVSGADIRVEHWVVAERQGQVAARNMLGERIPYRAVPFFWSQHYDVPINYVGHAEGWDRIDMDGDPMKRDCVARYVKGGKVLAVASIYRDFDSLKAAAEMEQIAKSRAP
jgi:NADPH-dependent 2,4-dienoyl-CoA reductase/sulfur reductase-like enzyme/nitrite reductase/ring-hydroxylating ferredoxin subunit